MKKTFSYKYLYYLLAVFFFVFRPLTVFSDVYMYVDKNGIINFTGVPTSAEYQLFIKELPENALKKAKQGNAQAQLNLAWMYYQGEGVTQDYKQAVHWWTKAAEQGNASAQYNLGVMYYQGEGVTQNFKLAYVWANLAAAQGIENAIINRDLTAKKMSPQQLIEVQELSAQIQEKIDKQTRLKK